MPMTSTICDNCGTSELRERGAVLVVIDYPGGEYQLCKSCLGPGAPAMREDPGWRDISNLTAEVMRHCAEIRATGRCNWRHDTRHDPRGRA